MMNHKQPVTIIDVARHANVSPGTVSNALSGKRPVSEPTRQRILRAIDELDYHPNLLARGLVNQRSGTLGVVTSGLEFYGPSRMLVGIERMTHELGYSLLLEVLHRPDEPDVHTILEGLTARQVDGIIWAVPEVGSNGAWVQAELLDRLPPAVFMTMKARSGVTTIGTNNRHGANLAVQHLLNQGRRRIGLITGPLDWWSACERQAGWHDTLEQAGVEPARSLVVEGNWTVASGERGIHQLLAHSLDIDAVFASNDQMALGVLRAAHLLGRRIPDDLAVVGFDNVPEAAYFWPSLTTVRQHLIELGRIAVQELQSAIEVRRLGAEKPRTVVHRLSPELIVRESSVSFVAGVQ